jgi:hypothetical protein
VPVVRRVDLIAALVSDPHPLFQALTQTLSLPAMWEPFDALGWSSGGVSLGSIALETFTPAKGREVAVPLDCGGLTPYILFPNEVVQWAAEHDTEIAVDTRAAGSHDSTWCALPDYRDSVVQMSTSRYLGLDKPANLA